uniref:Uncharacterized protein n=1 Tax=Anguilla anguilla TaxID=7936 RepID=A0A0E9X6Z2_ANGAN
MQLGFGIACSIRSLFTAILQMVNKTMLTITVRFKKKVRVRNLLNQCNQTKRRKFIKNKKNKQTNKKRTNKTFTSTLCL